VGNIGQCWALLQHITGVCRMRSMNFLLTYFTDDQSCAHLFLLFWIPYLSQMLLQSVCDS